MYCAVSIRRNIHIADILQTPGQVGTNTEAATRTGISIFRISIIPQVTMAQTGAMRRNHGTTGNPQTTDTSAGTQAREVLDVAWMVLLPGTMSKAAVVLGTHGQRTSPVQAGKTGSHSSELSEGERRELLL